MSKSIIDNIEISSDSDKENTDEEYSDEKVSDEENQKIFFISFSIFKKDKINIIKNKNKDSEKKHVKDIKIFLKKKQIKGEKKPKEDVKILLRKKKKDISIIRNAKKKLLEYRRNYYLTHKN